MITEEIVPAFHNEERYISLDDVMDILDEYNVDEDVKEEILQKSDTLSVFLKKIRKIQ